MDHSVIVILSYVSLFVMLFCLVVLSTQKSSYMQKLALLVCFALTMCSLGFLFKCIATDASTYITGQKIAYLFTSSGMFLMLMFVMEYCGITMPLPVRWIFHALNFIVALGALTLDYHTLFYKSYTAIPMGGYVQVEKVYGPIHTLAVALFVIYLLAALAVTITFLINNRHGRRKYALRILIAILIPCIFYIVPKLTGSSNDLQAVGFAIFSLMMLYMTYQNNLYDVDNIAADLSIASMEEAFIVLDGHNLFKGCNKIAQELFPELRNVVLDSDVLAQNTGVGDLLSGKVTEYRSDDKIYSVDVRSIEGAELLQGRVLKFTDVTMQREYTELLEMNKAQIDKDLAMAKNIQTSVLPIAGQVFDAVPQVDVAAYMETAKAVGGDFYDFYLLGKDKAVFLIADVSGKGIPAALFMMRAKTAIRSLAESGLPVNEVFTKANEHLCEGNDAHMFVTAWMGILELDSGHVTFANAGHNPPIIVKKDGHAEYLKSRAGMVLAGMEGINYKLQELQLEEGDRLFLYTDGVTEATDIHNKLYGEDRLLRLMSEKHELDAKGILNAVKEDIDLFVEEAEQFDDITMVTVDYLS